MRTEKVEPYLFNFMRDPSVLGGSPKNADIRTMKGYNTQYNDYIRKNETIPFRIYSDFHKNEFLYYFQIVSQTEPEVVYDVLIKFYLKGERKNLGVRDTIEEFDFQVFSNSPGFCFKYAYVFNKGGYLIPTLKNKIHEVDTPPTKTNPEKAYGYDYTVYFAMYFLYLHKQYLSLREIKRIAKPYANFNRDDILDSFSAYKKRNEKYFSTFERVKRATKSIVNKPKDVIKSVASSMGIIKAKSATKAVGTRKAKKATGTKHRIFK